jgi:hypothetical protein
MLDLPREHLDVAIVVALRDTHEYDQAATDGANTTLIYRNVRSEHSLHDRLHGNNVVLNRPDPGADRSMMTRTADLPDQIVVRAFGVAAIVVAIQLVAAAVFFDSRHLLLAAIAPLLVGVAMPVARQWTRSAAPLAMVATSVAIAVDVGMVDQPRFQLLGIAAIIVLGLIAVMLSAHRWVGYMVGFTSLIIVSNSYWNRGGNLVEHLADGMSLAIIFLIGASLATWVRARKEKADERYHTLVRGRRSRSGKRISQQSAGGSTGCDPKA